jgi:alanine dehydrogenase
MSSILLLPDAQVRGLLGMQEAIEVVEAAFVGLAEGRVQMPPKLYLEFPRFVGDLRIMPAAMGGELAGVKVVNSHARNPERGLPAVAGTYLLAEQETGRVIALMGATQLTAIRTAAASAVATKHMAADGASSLGLVGSGVQAGFHLEAITLVAQISRVVVWAPAAARERRDRFVKAARERFPELSITPVEEVVEAAAADIVCTTTPSHRPVVPDAAVLPGTHINAVGADGPGKQELDPAILRRAWVIVDEIEQARHGGEVNVPLASGEISEADIDGSLGEVVAGKIPGRTSQDEVTVFDSTGLAIEDLAVASVAFRKAKEQGIGTRLDW